ncbi:hypothetical protein ACFLXH_01670 [Chloroflexota bacterium]
MRYLVKTKACKRCGGDLSLERDNYGAYIQCIQCGATWNISPVRHVRDKAESEPRKKQLVPVK